MLVVENASGFGKTGVSSPPSSSDSVSSFATTKYDLPSTPKSLSLRTALSALLNARGHNRNIWALKGVAGEEVGELELGVALSFLVGRVGRISGTRLSERLSLNDALRSHFEKHLHSLDHR